MNRAGSRTARSLLAALVVVLGACGEGQRATMSGGPSHAALDCGACHTGSTQGSAVAPAPNSACAGCHEPDELTDTVSLGSTRFVHARHGVGGARSGASSSAVDSLASAVPVSCSSCHTHTSGKDSLRVEAGVCFDCHRAGGESDLQASTIAPLVTPCLGCHSPTKTEQTPSSAPIDHELVVSRDIPCSQCHTRTIAGTGAVDRSLCVSCHGPVVPGFSGPDRVAPDSLHRLHLAGDAGMACTRCHEPIAHGNVGMSATARLRCVSCHAAAHGTPADTTEAWSGTCVACHAGAHGATQRLYTGLADAGPPQPDTMFLARVACLACHTDAASHAAAGQARTAVMNDACVACHGPAFEGMLPRWQRSLDRRVSVTNNYLAIAASDARVTGSPNAVALLDSARGDVALVRTGGGAHNVPGADALLRSAIGRVRAAWTRAVGQAPAAPPLGPDPGATTCAYCHYGVEETGGTVYGESFSHADHVVKGDVPCARCHSSADYYAGDGKRVDPAHGRTTVTAAQCESCHHAGTQLACTTCHARRDLVGSAQRVSLDLTALKPDAAPESRPTTFRHADHPDVECTSCHTSRQSVRSVAACSTCHADHHARATTCTTCHGTDALAAHDVDSHLACVRCHDRGTLELLTPNRAFCLSCHVDQADHRPGQECAPCHLQMTPAQVKSRILGSRP